MNLNIPLLSTTRKFAFRRSRRFNPLRAASISLLAACAVSLAPRIHAASLPSESDHSSSATASPASSLADAPSTVLFSSSLATPLPEAPIPAAEAGIFSRKTTAVSRAAKLESEAERNAACEHGTLRGKPCRVSWPRVLGESFIFLSSQHGGNIAMDSDTRSAIRGNIDQGSFWSTYVYCVEHYRWSRWKDDDPFGVDYIGHPMMGAVTSSIYEQNDPKQRALAFENTQRYWMGRLRAMAYSAAYSAQWKVGPLSEASVGNTGRLYYYSDRIHAYTNETGMQDFFVTPIGGFVENIGEDALERSLMTKIRHKTRNRFYLFAASLMMPGRAAANITRFRAPYYRDSDVPPFVASKPTATPAESVLPSSPADTTASPANSSTPNF